MADRAARLHRLTVLAALLVAFGWLVGVAGPGALAAWAAYRSGVVVAAAWLALAAIGLIAGVSLLRGRPPPAAILLTALAAVDITVVAACRPGMLLGPGAWVWRALGWFVLLVLWARPLATAALLAGHAGVGLAALVATDRAGVAALGSALTSLYAVAALQLAVAVAARALRDHARRAGAAADGLAAVEARREPAERAHRARKERAEELTHAAEGLLADLAAGRADPRDEWVRHAAAGLAARLRRLSRDADEVPDPLLAELLAGADRAELAGLDVEVACAGTLPPLPDDVRRDLLQPLAPVIASARGRLRITVAANPDEVALAVVSPHGDAPAQPAVGSGHVTYTCRREEDLLWAETRWRRH